jgi:hypothetical protein
MSPEKTFISPSMPMPWVMRFSLGAPNPERRATAW